MNVIPQDAARLLDTAARAAREAAAVIARAPTPAKNLALREAAAALRRNAAAILAANAADLEAAPDLSGAFRDRLTLTPARIEAMAAGIEDVAALPDPVGRVLAEWTRPNGLVMRRVAQPLGVIGMIFESRPNVTADAAVLCLKSGNAVILRGGSESTRSATAIHACLAEGLRAAALPEAAIQVAPTADRAFVGAMLRASGLIDLIVPRGGKGLVTRVMEEARVPVLAHAEGLCHTYIHEAADPAMARAILANAKMRRTGVCGATETLLIDAAIAPSLLPLLVADLRALGCDFRVDDLASRHRRRPARGERAGFRHRMARRHPVGEGGAWRGRGAGPYPPLRLRAHRGDHHAGRGRGARLPRWPRFRRRHVECVHAVLRRLRIRLRRRDRHRDGADACARPGRAGTALHLSLPGDRHGPDAAMMRGAAALLLLLAAAAPARAACPDVATVARFARALLEREVPTPFAVATMAEARCAQQRLVALLAQPWGDVPGPALAAEALPPLRGALFHASLRATSGATIDTRYAARPAVAPGIVLRIGADGRADAMAPYLALLDLAAMPGGMDDLQRVAGNLGLRLGVVGAEAPMPAATPDALLQADGSTVATLAHAGLAASPADLLAGLAQDLAAEGNPAAARDAGRAARRPGADGATARRDLAALGCRAGRRGGELPLKRPSRQAHGAGSIRPYGGTTPCAACCSRA